MKNAVEVSLPWKQIEALPAKTNLGDLSMRNVAFSVLMFALAVVQIAVVTSELPRSHVHTVAASNAQSATRVALASQDVVFSSRDVEHRAAAF